MTRGSRTSPNWRTHTWAGNLPALDQAVREVVVLAADLPDEAMADLELDYAFRTGDSTVDLLRVVGEATVAKALWVREENRIRSCNRRSKDVPPG